MRHQEQQTPFHSSQGLPAILATLEPILRYQGEGIGKSKAGKIEADPVLAQIGDRLGRIPLKADPHTQMLLQMS